ncbi:MAG: GNAT family N-acetyltransferase [Eubacteriales bacterium]|nr:GNAT family N-acetyltransferase [Eubacteriales bacterium]
MEFECYTFEELDKQLLYDILGHRQEIFILGRHDIYRDLDGFDQKALHLLYRNAAGEIEGYVRLLPAGVHYDGYEEHCFGRLSVKEKARGKGLGSELVRRGIEILLKDSSCRQVRISAMAYLEDFYRELGFERTSDVFDISGVPHVTMLYTGKPL